ncbi:right-handed parallel beta-helix repeat-containing protein [Paenibacillus sp. OSY-SE]|uniref:right-handed parallel beta-helix repeat-containing protein n=1 Tax=Paenibacillus sp. OSY-SE TaxID=1196323 RepID=UPI0002F8B610|nr:right-handed parallel beta-helix repeat-containing protein [Paenibacillus sp. OSY-SE]
MSNPERFATKLKKTAALWFVFLLVITLVSFAGSVSGASAGEESAAMPQWAVQEPDSGTPTGKNAISCSTASCLSSALKNVMPGNKIVLAPGTYKGSFSSDVNGTAEQPIIIQSEDPANPAVLSGHSTGSGFSLRVRGDYWNVRDLQFTNAQKGIILDHSNHTLITNVEVYNIGSEGVHFRDGSSYSTIQNSNIHHTGRTSPGYGEGVYVGSAEGASYNQATHYNTIRNVVIGPHVTAEHIDIKERTLGTVVENCTFYGEGISGKNYADSFIDVKGNEAVIRNNVGYQDSNSNIIDAFQLHQIVAGWGINNKFTNNTLHLDDPAVYVVAGYGNASASATQNTRIPAGNMYKGNIAAY